MSEKVIVTKSKITNLADKVRAKVGTSINYTIDAMAAAVENLQLGVDESSIYEELNSIGYGNWCTVMFLNYDGTVLYETNVKKGETAEYIGETPTHSEGYNFLGWSNTEGSKFVDADFTITGDTNFYPVYDKPDEITLTYKSAYVKPALTLASCTGADEEITIDWGDGDVVTYTITTSGTRCEKPYMYSSTNTLYTMKLPATENYKITNGIWWGGYADIKTFSGKYWRFSYSSFFQESINLTSITIPKVSSKIGVTTLGSFYNCTNLTSITIPEGITNVNNNLFDNCISLTDIIFENNNSLYKTVDGVVYSKDGTQLIIYPLGKKDTVFVIPEGVTILYTAVFRGCTNLTSITIPDGVTSIRQAAFNGCSNLTSIIIPISVTSIGQFALKIGSVDNKATIIFESETPPTIEAGSYAPFDTSKLQAIKVPASAVETYKSATNWSAFADYIVGYEEE